MKFVWLNVPGGGAIPVNPDQVAYLRAGEGDNAALTQVVFGAVNGGLHSVTVLGDGRDVAATLEGPRKDGALAEYRSRTTTELISAEAAGDHGGKGEIPPDMRGVLDAVAQAKPSLPRPARPAKRRTPKA